MFPTRSRRSSVAEGTSPPRAARLRSKSPFYNCDNNLQPYHQHREESRGEQSSKAISFKEEETREEARGREVVLGGSRGGVGWGRGRRNDSRRSASPRLRRCTGVTDVPHRRRPHRKERRWARPRCLCRWRGGDGGRRLTCATLRHLRACFASHLAAAPFVVGHTASVTPRHGAARFGQIEPGAGQIQRRQSRICCHLAGRARRRHSPPSAFAASHAPERKRHHRRRPRRHPPSSPASFPVVSSGGSAGFRPPCHLCVATRGLV